MPYKLPEELQLQLERTVEWSMGGQWVFLYGNEEQLKAAQGAVRDAVTSLDKTLMEIDALSSDTDIKMASLQRAMSICKTSEISEQNYIWINLSKSGNDAEQERRVILSALNMKRSELQNSAHLFLFALPPQYGTRVNEAAPDLFHARQASFSLEETSTMRPERQIKLTP